MSWHKPGFIPEGWTRGEKLTVYEAVGHTRDQMGRRGQIMQAPSLSVSFVPPPDTYVYLTFWYDDADEVRAWLKWWDEAEEDDDLL